MNGAEVLPAPGLSMAHISSRVSDGPWLRSDPEFDRNRTGVVWAKGGAFSRIQFQRTKRDQVGGGLRGEVVRYSRQSYFRCLEAVCRIDTRMIDRQRAWFVTLTYPGRVDLVPQDPRRWKRDLDVLRHRWERALDNLTGFWKLEFQEQRQEWQRGSNGERLMFPHFHLLLIVSEELAGQMETVRKWLSQAWCAVAGSGDAEHLQAGTAVEIVKSWEKVRAYASKYFSKEQLAPVDPDTGEIKGIGRFWGVWRRSEIPTEEASASLNVDQACRVRRVLRRFSGIRTTARLLTFRCVAPDEMVTRLVEWAREGGSKPDFRPGRKRETVNNVRIRKLRVGAQVVGFHCGGQVTGILHDTGAAVSTIRTRTGGLVNVWRDQVYVLTGELFSEVLTLEIGNEIRYRYQGEVCQGAVYQLTETAVCVVRNGRERWIPGENVLGVVMPQKEALRRQAEALGARTDTALATVGADLGPEPDFGDPFAEDAA